MRATFRTAAVVAAGAVTAVTLPAAHAFAADAPAPAPGTATTPGAAPTAPAEEPGREAVGRTFVKAYGNLGGSGLDARVYETKGGHEADILNGKAVRHTLKTDGSKADSARHDGVRFVLATDGTLKGWTEGAGAKAGDGAMKPAPEATAKAAPKVIPRGAVMAGAEGVGTSGDGAGAGAGAAAGDSAGLIAGTAGLAAVGAASLGFALLRRGRTEG
uniref:Uncharacterized protein n=1 Tax=Streptomyces sp. NBC_00049 TaxID=2903617 RepID=A0AAU2JNH7_9ACTN